MCSMEFILGGGGKQTEFPPNVIDFESQGKVFSAALPAGTVRSGKRQQEMRLLVSLCVSLCVSVCVN